MGFYVNPPDMTKEEWLAEKVVQPYFNISPEMPEDDSLALVCIVQNAAFSALGVAYNTNEMNRFARGAGERPRVWAIVKKEDLYAVCPIKAEDFVEEDW